MIERAELALSKLNAYFNYSNDDCRMDDDLIPLRQPIQEVIDALREIKSEPIYQVDFSNGDCCWNECPKTFYDKWHEEKRILYAAPQPESK